MWRNFWKWARTKNWKIGWKHKKRFEKDEQQFREDLQEDIEQFEERIKYLLVMLNRTHTDSGFVPIFNIHSGIDKLGLFLQ